MLDLHHILAFDAEPVFREEHNSCESWTVGIGAEKASRIVNDWIKGRAPYRPHCEVIMIGFAEDPGELLALGDDSRKILNTRMTMRANIERVYCQLEMDCGLRRGGR